MRTAAPPSAARVVPAAPVEAFAAIVRRAVDAAFERGREQGLRDAFAAAAGSLERASGEVAAAVEAARAEVGETAVRLALEIASTLLRAEVDAGRYDLERVVRDALEDSGVGRAPCTVHLNPVDLRKLDGVRFRAGTELVGDPAVSPGDVHVATADGLLVRELDRAVRSIGERILGDLR